RVTLDGDERGRVEQFLSVPVDAETCGPIIRDEDRSAFVSVQHPGEDGEWGAHTSYFPDYDGRGPKPTVVQVLPIKGKNSPQAIRHTTTPQRTLRGRPPFGARADGCAADGDPRRPRSMFSRAASSAVGAPVGAAVVPVGRGALLARAPRVVAVAGQQDHGAEHGGESGGGE